jgi:hypothetical protein
VSGKTSEIHAGKSLSFFKSHTGTDEPHFLTKSKARKHDSHECVKIRTSDSRCCNAHRRRAQHARFVP